MYNLNDTNSNKQAWLRAERDLAVNSWNTGTTGESSEIPELSEEEFYKVLERVYKPIKPKSSPKPS